MTGRRAGGATLVRLRSITGNQDSDACGGVLSGNERMDLAHWLGLSITVAGRFRTGGVTRSHGGARPPRVADDLP
jgi:hypothetical protein